DALDGLPEFAGAPGHDVQHGTEYLLAQILDLSQSHERRRNKMSTGRLRRQCAAIQDLPWRQGCYVGFEAALGLRIDDRSDIGIDVAGIADTQSRHGADQ